MEKSELVKLTGIEMSNIKITEETRKYAVEHGCRGDVRITTGRFYTDKEYESYSKNILSKEIPK